MSEKASKKLKIFIYAVDGYGHMAATVGLGQALASRGHRIFFLLNENFEAQFSQYGTQFTLVLLRNNNNQSATKEKEEEEDEKETTEEDKKKKKTNMLALMAQSLKENGMLCAGTPLEKMRKQMAVATDDDDATSFSEIILRTMVNFDGQIEAALEREKPDLFVLDNFLVPPALQRRHASLPWVLSVSAQPLCIFSHPNLPPFGGGFPTASDPATWAEYRELLIEYNWEKFGKYQERLDDACRLIRQDEKSSDEVPPPPPPPPLRTKDARFFTPSPLLNVYSYPRELDYAELFPVPPNFVQVDTLMREVPEGPFRLPEELQKRATPGSALIYLSLGSLGAIDVPLMSRIVAVLGRTRHRYIVSTGQRASEYEHLMPANCWGRPFLPQTRILPLVDLVITHGGNNTVTEAFSFGKKQIVLCLFGDQFDNAQRLTELGFGLRLETYTFADQELIDAIETLLANEAMQRRLDAAAHRIAQSQSKAKACQRIEEMVVAFRSAKSSFY